MLINDFPKKYLSRVMIEFNECSTMEKDEREVMRRCRKMSIALNNVLTVF